MGSFDIRICPNCSALFDASTQKLFNPGTPPDRHAYKCPACNAEELATYWKTVGVETS